MQKTIRRQVVTLELSAFQSLEVVRTTSDHQVRHSPRLSVHSPTSPQPVPATGTVSPQSSDFKRLGQTRMATLGDSTRPR